MRKPGGGGTSVGAKQSRASGKARTGTRVSVGAVRVTLPCLFAWAGVVIRDPSRGGTLFATAPDVEQVQLLERSTANYLFVLIRLSAQSPLPWDRRPVLSCELVPRAVDFPRPPVGALNRP